ncbi:hypothetical protein [Enterococcus bulliens]|uniref:hypothetical protein n=1 Tax=uncultured Enterococcus sp. TaxID=167972 RepID=UPI0025E8A2D4|nr:hypothetical protein [uncultured Enterococcus sp.]
MNQNEEMMLLLTTLTHEIHALHEEIHQIRTINANLQKEHTLVDHELRSIKLAILNDNIMG